MSKSEDLLDKNSKQKIVKSVNNKKTVSNTVMAQNARIIQKKIVYVIGLSYNLSSEKVNDK